MSLRIDAITSMVPNTDTVADIGCDHGKTAVSLLLAGKAKNAICTDISKRSLEKAGRLAAAKGIEDKVELREGDGFDVLNKGEADAAVIAGMGGELITRILAAGKDKAPDKLVLSCNTKPGTLRKWLCENGYVIENEELVLEGKRFYPIILAKKGESPQLSEQELEFGPVLLKKTPRVLAALLEKRIQQAEKKLNMIITSGTGTSKRTSDAVAERIKILEEIRNACKDR